ncbi:MAG: hypothetical protein HKN24_08310 [Acidimicrobiales bacterium]|nr:hypothetical protein [Acidimicrobiales bacterium]
MFDRAELAPSAERKAAVEQAWTNLTGPGPTLTATTRCSVIRAARAAWAGGSSPDAPLEDHVAHWVAVDAGGLRSDHVELWAAAGLKRITYLEIVGVVSRLANVDFYLRGLGAPVPEIPPLPSGSPTGDVHQDARITDGWVPALANLRAPNVLDAMPSEGVAFRGLHEPMYMPMDQIDNWRFADVLSRPQIEFIAARVSFLNECFY